jgi:hypothetical protein
MKVLEVEEIKSLLTGRYPGLVTHYEKDPLVGYWVYFRMRRSTARNLEGELSGSKHFESLGDNEYRISTGRKDLSSVIPG